MRALSETALFGRRVVAAEGSEEAQSEHHDVGAVVGLSRLVCSCSLICSWLKLCCRVGNGTRSPYKFANLTAQFTAKFLLGAQQHHGVSIDYVGVWNERAWDANYIKTLRKVLDASGLQRVKAN